MYCRLVLLDKASGELLSSYEGHVHESVSMDCCLTPSDAHVVGSSETGERGRVSVDVPVVGSSFEAGECGRARGRELWRRVSVDMHVVASCGGG